MKSKLKQYLTFLIGWPFSLLALYFILKTFLPKSQQILQNLTSLNVWLLITGMFCFLGYYFVRSIIWQLIMQEFGYHIPFHHTVILWAQSEFKRYIPGNIWSFLGRAMLFSEKGVSKKDVAKGLFFEAQLIFLACGIVALFSLPFIAEHFFSFLSTSFIIYSLVFIILFGLIIYIFQSFIIKRLPVKFNKLTRTLFVNLPAQIIFKLLFLSICAFIFFGIGYYFTIASIVFLDPRLVLTLTGFFVFSLLVGLLSFITPTGLGVREGAITFGLAKLVGVTMAGFASIFGRIILVLSEILFILFAYTYHKIGKFGQRIEGFIGKHIPEFILGIMILVFCIFFSIISILRHDNFYTGRFDLGNMAQTVWNTKHGNFFKLTDPNGTQIVSRLSFHSDFFLVLLVPFYYIWENPRMLLIVQAVVVGLGAIFVYLLAKKIFHNKLISLSIAFSYLINPALQRATIFDFHAITLATTFLLGAFYFLQQKRFFWFIIFALLAALTKEEIWIVVGLLGGFIVLTRLFDKKLPTIKEKVFNKEVILGILTMLISVIIFYTLVWYAIPKASQSEHFALSYFSENNDSPTTLMKSVLLSPQKSIAKLLQKERVSYLKQLLLPVGYIPLASPLYLLFSGVDLTINILSDKAELHQIYYQYTAAITPFLFIATLYGIRMLRKHFVFIPLSFFTGYITIAALWGAYLYGPLPWAKMPNTDMFNKPNLQRTVIMSLLRDIPRSYKVTASNNIAAHLSHRDYIYTLPLGINKADVVAILLTDINPEDPDHTVVSQLRDDPAYKLTYEKDNFILFERIR